VSGRRNRETRRDERLSEEQQAGAGERRETLIKAGSAAAFLAVAVVAVLIVVSQSQSGGGDSSNIQHASEVDRELAGIPQNGMALGKPSAKVTLLEFGDLQCTACKGYSEEVLPQVIEDRVRSGEARIDFRNYTVIGTESTPAGAAAIAAGEQGRGWNFVETFYRNQGNEDSGYVTDEFLTAIAKAAGVRDIARWNTGRKSARILREVANSTSQAKSLGFTGTPSFAVEGPKTSGLEALKTPIPTDGLESAISSAAD
jgi:protein-disulfide isomerase